jgi:REP element-mobilizing transposase RayT
MNTLPKRKPNRLNNYDYSNNGAYFITICVNNRKCLLSRVVGADTIRPSKLELSQYGLIVDNAIKSIPLHYEDIFVDNYVIMPNHIHILLRIENNSGRMISAPTVIGSLKRAVSKQIGFSIWQKGFYDHVIRDDYDYKIRWQYIDDNPIKWLDDEYYINE